mmetsp:Transcript_10222/g.20973  ORF Transcript_10222/g.20973 Transcript_10222/m.20973 type:complete len:155 (-) Transcript_10222:8-472(-)
MSLVRSVLLRVPAAAAKPGPAIGQALGPLGVNMAEFVKQFNDATSSYKPNTPLPVKLSAFSDRTFSFVVQTPPTSELIKQAANVKAGANRPGAEVVGYITPQAVYEIARIKQRDSHREFYPLEGIAKSVVGTCNSMGIVVREEEEGEGDDDDKE